MKAPALTCLVASFLALPAAAQSSPWYLGAAAGQSKAASSLVTDREATIGNGNEPQHADLVGPQGHGRQASSGATA